MFRHGLTFPSRVAIVNQSTLIQDSDLATISQALMQALPGFCTAWNVQNVMVTFIPKGKPAPSGSTCIYVLDDSDVQGAYGYHDTTGTVAYAKVFVKRILENGGGLLAHTPSSNVSVAQVISHELFEMLAHTICNSWWMTSDASAFYAAEVCDPVQGNVVSENIAGKLVDLSDYVLPTWSNPESKSGPYNKLNTVKKPMTVDKHGYSIKVYAGTVSCVFGESVDQATKDKQIASMKSDKRFASMSFA